MDIANNSFECTKKIKKYYSNKCICCDNTELKNRIKKLEDDVRYLLDMIRSVK